MEKAIAFLSDTQVAVNKEAGTFEPEDPEHLSSWFCVK